MNTIKNLNFPRVVKIMRKKFTLKNLALASQKARTIEIFIPIKNILCQTTKYNNF